MKRIRMADYKAWHQTIDTCCTFDAEEWRAGKHAATCALNALSLKEAIEILDKAGWGAPEYCARSLRRRFKASK